MKFYELRNLYTYVCIMYNYYIANILEASYVGTSVGQEKSPSAKIT